MEKLSTFCTLQLIYNSNVNASPVKNHWSSALAVKKLTSQTKTQLFVNKIISECKKTTFLNNGDFTVMECRWSVFVR